MARFSASSARVCSLPVSLCSDQPSRMPLQGCSPGRSPFISTSGPSARRWSGCGATPPERPVRSRHSRPLARPGVCRAASRHGGTQEGLPSGLMASRSRLPGTRAPWIHPSPRRGEAARWAISPRDVACSPPGWRRTRTARQGRRRTAARAAIVWMNRVWAQRNSGKGRTGWAVRESPAQTARGAVSPRWALCACRVRATAC